MLKDGIIGQVESQTLELGLAQNFKWTWQLKNKFKMILKKECSCILRNVLFPTIVQMEGCKPK
jgi:hypothetical protein